MQGEQIVSDLTLPPPAPGFGGVPPVATAPPQPPLLSHQSQLVATTKKKVCWVEPVHKATVKDKSPIPPISEQERDDGRPHPAPLQRPRIQTVYRTRVQTVLVEVGLPIRAQFMLVWMLVAALLAHVHPSLAGLLFFAVCRGWRACVPYIRVPNYPKPARWMLQSVLDAISFVAQFVDERAIHSYIAIILLAVVVGMMYNSGHHVVAVATMALVYAFFMWAIHQNPVAREVDSYEDSNTDDDQSDMDPDGQ